jgi:hypothetical protein
MEKGARNSLDWNFSLKESLVDADTGINDSETTSPILMQKTEEHLDVSSYRWIILLVFGFCTTANAIVLYSFSAVTDLANQYWDNIGITMINLLVVVTQLMYAPGTALGFQISRKYNLRRIMIWAGAFNTIGCIIRYAGVLLRFQGLTATGSYSVVIFGTAVTALAQPFYQNLPSKVAGYWFPTNERDLSTTLASLASPLGIAIGSILSPAFVTGHTGGNYDAHDIHGVDMLVLAHLVMSAVGLLAVIFCFRSAPHKPPSYSSLHMKSSSLLARPSIYKELMNLWRNSDYIYVLISFSIVYANLNSIAALINQLPGDYSNDEVGFTAAGVILTGFVGSLVVGLVLDYTKQYKAVLKISYCTTVPAWIIASSGCRPGNFPLFISGACLLGCSLFPSGVFYHLLTRQYFVYGRYV